MPISVTAYASDLRVVVEIVSVEHLFDGVDASGQKIAFLVVFPFALLAERTCRRRALVYDVTVLVALIADCFLRASVTVVLS